MGRPYESLDCILLLSWTEQTIETNYCQSRRKVWTSHQTLRILLVRLALGDLLEAWTSGQLDKWTIEHLDTWTSGQLDNWTSGNLDTWTVDIGKLDQAWLQCKSSSVSTKLSWETGLCIWILIVAGDVPKQADKGHNTVQCVVCMMQRTLCSVFYAI